MALPPFQLMDMVLMKGAAALGIADQVGSLKVGKKADIITVDMTNPYLAPTKDPLTSVVLYGSAGDIDNVIVDGRLLKKDGRLTTIDMPAALEAIKRAGERRGALPKLHVLDASVEYVSREWFERSVPISRAEGEILELQAEPIAQERLGDEWEWEESPEVTIAVVDSVDEAVEWFNRYSPIHHGGKRAMGCVYAGADAVCVECEQEHYQ